MEPYAFAPAAPDEEVVYGACRPGHPRFGGGRVVDWLAHVRSNDVVRVVCLLDDAHLDLYDPDLLATYERTFGADDVLHAPVQDRTTIDRRTFEEDVLPFLDASDAGDARTVVHCSAGMGRTGHVLAGWLVRARGYELADAIRAVQATGRRPLEGGKTIEDLRDAFDVE